MSSKEEEELKKKRREEIKKIIEEFEIEKEIERQKIIENKVKEIENKNLIKIDNLYFLVLNKNITEDRPIVNIYSSTNENFSENNNKFSVYLSRSDLGCFQLCVRLHNQYVKGDDYIQSTFIHIKLQKYIHQIFEKLIPSNDHFCSYIESETDGKNGHKLYDHIYEKERQIKKTPFIEYNIYACGDDNDKSSSDVNEKLNNFSEELKSLYDYSNNEPISKVNINDSENVYDLKFYKVKLKLKLKEEKQEDNIILYYCNAKITKFMNKTPKSFPIYINLPVFLTTIEGDKITKFGTFERYILAGNYICKVFDYYNQCSENHSGKCYGNYKLIGDRYNNIFPLLEIREEKFAELAGGVIQIINDRCNSNIKNIRDSNCNQKIQKIQNVYNVRKQLIEDTERFFNKKINYLTI
jgi:hypothetical protein